MSQNKKEQPVPIFLFLVIQKYFHRLFKSLMYLQSGQVLVTNQRRCTIENKTIFFIYNKPLRHVLYFII